MKIAIVGASEGKWKPKQIPEAKKHIKQTLGLTKVSELKICKDGKWRPIITLVSGRCPVSICDNCGKKSFSEITNPIVGYVKCEFCGQEKKRRAGGIDVWAEGTAIELKIETEIYAPEVNQWDDAYDFPVLGSPTKKLKGYRSRNLQIVNALNPETDVLVCINPKGVRSGGSWVADRARERGIKVVMVEVD